MIIDHNSHAQRPIMSNPMTFKGNRSPVSPREVKVDKYLIKPRHVSNECVSTILQGTTDIASTTARSVRSLFTREKGDDNKAGEEKSFRALFDRFAYDKEVRQWNGNELNQRGHRFCHLGTHKHPFLPKVLNYYPQKSLYSIICHGWSLLYVIFQTLP